MKKLIDIPEEDDILRDLKILAIKGGTDLKNFIQDQLVKLVKEARKKKIV